VTLVAFLALTSSVRAHDVQIAGPSPGSVQGATVALGADGRILVAGGEVRMWDPRQRQWTSQMSGGAAARRYWHTATTLRRGPTILVGGLETADGSDRPQNAVASVSLWNAKLDAWSVGPSLLTPRVAHAAALLLSDEVLIVGGASTAHRGRAFGPLLSNVELVSDKTTSTRASMTAARAYHTATTLADGRVLVIGGVDENGQALASTELYDPRADRWTAGPSLLAARREHTATLLPDGSVLVVGGFDSNGRGLPETERWRPDTPAWQAAGLLAAARGQHQATLLRSGDLLISGGVRESTGERFMSPVLSLELRNAASGEWQPAGELPLSMRDLRALLMHDDTVLLFGYDPYFQATLAWSKNAPEHVAVSATIEAAITPLDGRFLLTGGHRRQEPTAAALLYDPRADRWTSTRPMHWPRSNHRAVRLRDGRVLVLGGTIAGVSTSDAKNEPIEFPAEIWDPRTERWTLSTSLKYRSGAWAEPALLADGRVMLGAVENQNSSSRAVHFFRIWDPTDDSLTPLTQVPRMRSGGQALYYSDGHLLYLGGNDPESARDGRRLDFWDASTGSWKELRPAELSLNGLELHPLSDGGVLAWKRPERTGNDDRSELLLAWQPEFGWRTLPTPKELDAGSWFDAIALGDGELLLRMSERTMLWNAVDKRWQLVAHDARWGPDLGSYVAADGRLIAFRARQTSEVGFGRFEAVWFNRAALRWAPMTARYVARHFPALIALQDKSVMVAGGEVAITQLWNPQNDSWRFTGHTTRILRSPSGLRLADGRVMLAGVVAGREDTLACELWDPQSQTWSACGTFPTDQRLSRRSPVLRALDDRQVLLVHGEQRAMVWDGAQWIATRLQMPRSSSVPAPSAEGSPYLNDLASVWNPAHNRWDDATDVLFWYGLGWHGYRAPTGDVIATSGAFSLLEWNSKARTLRQLSLRSSIRESRSDALAATADDCLLAWPNGRDWDRRLPMAMLGNRDAGTWTQTSLTMNLPFDARAVTLADGTMLIAGQTRGPATGALSLRATCAGVEPLEDVGATYLPIATEPEASPTSPAAVETTLAPRRKPGLVESWVDTWKGHLRGAHERIKSKIAFGALLVLLIVRFFMNRWGAYLTDESGVAIGRRIDVAILGGSILVALVALGLPMRAIQVGVASVASVLAAFAATRLWRNAGEPGAKAIAAVPFAICAAMAVMVIGTYVADALYRTIRLLTNYS
jgi:hypothetical protein